MPIIKSAKKRMRQTAIHKARNQTTKRSLRSELKILGAAIEAKDGKKAAEALKRVQSNLDKALKKNLVKKNTVARRLSRLSDQVKALGAKPAPSDKKTTAKPAAKKPAVKKTAVKAAPKKAPAKKPTAKK